MIQETGFLWGRKRDLNDLVGRFSLVFMLSVLWFISGCAAELHLSPGHYKENAGSDTALFQSEELILGYDNSFQYIFNIDDQRESG